MTQDDNAEELAPSKSEIKRRMLALQQLGEELVQLNEKQLATIPVHDERLRVAVAEARRIKSHSARRRHLQYIGKLMRDMDIQPIQRALENLFQQKNQENHTFHQLEQLRDDMLAAGVDGVELALLRWPQADRQPLRLLLLQHQREVQRQQPLSAGRKLFRQLRELQNRYGGD